MRMNKGHFFVAAVLLFMAAPFPAAADVIYLKNGRSIEGLVKKESADEVELEISFGSMKFSMKQIDHITRSSADETEAIRQGWADDKIKAQQRAREAELEREREPKQVNVDSSSGHVKVITTLNNKVKANLVLDTGASLILLSEKVADGLGVKNDKSATPVELIMADGRRVEAKMVVLESVKVQDAEARGVEAAVLTGKNSVAIPEDGLLGMSFLKKFNFKIDQRNEKLILEKL